MRAVERGADRGAFETRRSAWRSTKLVEAPREAGRAERKPCAETIGFVQVALILRRDLPMPSSYFIEVLEDISDKWTTSLTAITNGTVSAMHPRLTWPCARASGGTHPPLDGVWRAGTPRDLQYRARFLRPHP